MSCSVRGWYGVTAGGILTLAGCGASGQDAPTLEGSQQSLAAPDRRLPEPEVWRVPKPAQSDAEKRRQAEVDDYVLGGYTGRRIVATTQTYGGDILDWIDPAGVPGSRLPAPPHSPNPDGSPPQPSAGAATELDTYPELRGPAGTIPYLRPSFAAYVKGRSPAHSLSEHLERYVPSGQPAGQDRLYGGFRLRGRNTQLYANIHQFAAAVQDDANLTFSLLEMATACTNSVGYELIGAALTRGTTADPLTLRFDIEFVLTDGSHGWNEFPGGPFVAYAGRPYPPGIQLTFISVSGGTQYVSPVEIKLFNGNWWIGHNNNWLGYYPGTTFSLISSSTGGCFAQWYGEVYDSSPTNWTWTDMGQGYFANAGFGFASFFQQPFYTDSAGVLKWPDTATRLKSAVDPHCYTTSAMISAASPWDRYFYLGGPGAVAGNGCL